MTGFLSLIPLLFSCNGGTDPEPDTDSGTSQDVTWYQDVGPLLAEHCTSCHYKGDDALGAPYVFDNYADASLFAVPAAMATADRQMPPWGALSSDDCSNQWGWLDDLSLTDDEIALIQAWVDAGTPEGTDDGSAFPDPINGTSLDQVDIAMTIDSEWTVLESDDDVLRCFELDPQIENEAGWFSGFEVVPGNTAVNHHVIVFTVDEGSEGTDVLDEYRESYGLGESWECFGAASCNPNEDEKCPGTLGNKVVGAWTPNAGAVKLPPESAIRVDPGDRFVLQIHYHPQAGAAPESDDATRLELQYYEGTPLYEASMKVVGVFEPGQSFDDGTEMIPAGEEAWSNTVTKTLPNAAIWGVLPHMHVVGTEIRLDIDRQDGNDECIVHVPRWDYNWQRIYRLSSLYESETLHMESGPIVQSGDTATVTCTFNNSDSNSQLVEAYREEGFVDTGDEVIISDVPIGDGTTEEMCVAVVGLLQRMED